MNEIKKFIIIGDIHASFIGPKRRADNYYKCFLDKMQQIRKIQKNNNDCPIICLGDFFNVKVTEHLEKMVFDLVPLMKNWYSLIGNHDNNKENALDLRGTSFGLFKETNILKLGFDFKNKYDNNNVEFHFFDYYNRNLFKENKVNKNKINIAFIHDYVMPSNTKVNYKFKECEENDYNFVFCGHYHYDFDIKIGKTRFINPGSLMRMSITQEDINRHPKIVLFDFSKEDNIIYKEIKIDSSTSVFEDFENVLDNTFESKFTEMLLNNDLTNGDSNDIIKILENNKIDKKIINYISCKVNEVKE